MNISSLRRILDGTLPPQELCIMIADEVARYASPRNPIGGSIPIMLQADEDSVHIDCRAIRSLIDAYLGGTLSAAQVAYLCDGILLSDQLGLDSELVRECLEEMTDPEINGELTALDAMHIRQRCSEI